MIVIRSDEGKFLEENNFSKKIIAKDLDLLNKKALVQLIVIESGKVVAPHYHKNTLEVFYVIEGSGKIKVNDKTVTLRCGDTMICEPGDVHEVINDGKEVWKYIVFKTYNKKPDSYWIR